MNKNIPQDKPRRRLLNSIAAAGGTLLVGGQLSRDLPGSLLPKAWVRPIVESVVIPAHAQTSPHAQTSRCGVQTIPGFSVSCPTVANQLLFYGIRTAPAPCGFEVIPQAQPTAPYVSIVVTQSATDDPVFFEVRSFDTFGNQNGPEAAGFMQCSTNTLGVTDPFPIQALDENGAAYTVYGVFSSSGGTVTLSQLDVSI